MVGDWAHSPVERDGIAGCMALARGG